MKRALLLSISLYVCISGVSSADTFGTGDNQFEVEFVTIGNAGNSPDPSTGYGAVDYAYRIGTYEISNAQWNSFVNIAGKPTGNPSIDYTIDPPNFTQAAQPINSISSLEAFQFCNFLTSSDKSRGVYQFSGNNENPGDYLGMDREAAEATYGVIYFLPTENEWYKAAYFTGSGYSLYANGLDTILPADDGWNYYGGSTNTPWNVHSGTQEQNGTYNMMGNILEHIHSVDGHSYRGGHYWDYSSYLSSQYADYSYPTYPRVLRASYLGLRVASVPEPATVLLLGLGGLLILKRK